MVDFALVYEQAGIFKETKDFSYLINNNYRCMFFKIGNRFGVSESPQWLTIKRGYDREVANE